jgi:hypothetical protein
MAVLFMAAVALVLWGCRRETAANVVSAPPPAGPDIAGALAAAARPAPAAFEDVATSAGLLYRWTIAGARPMNILQSIGYGCAFLDYDNDGNLDVLLVGPSLALYRGDGHGRFTDVTREAGLNRLHGDFRGCCVGDYDNDGFDDVFISAYGGGTLLHNVRGRRFEDVTTRAGVGQHGWATSCVFTDLDNDGLLDLFVGHYVGFGPKSQQLCNYGGRMAACAPGAYGAEKGRVYRNLGNGRFTDMTSAWGFDAAHGKVLAAAVCPLSPGANPSLAIANDAIPSDMMTLHGGSARNSAAQWGTETLPGNIKYGGMGVDWGDFDGDGKLDLAVATFADQAKPIFRNVGGAFEIQSCEKLGMVSSAPRVTFGIKWIDYDNDGWLDLLLANGHIQDNVADVSLEKNVEAVYRQPTILYHSIEGKRFEDISSALSGPAHRDIVGRGLATGDFDNDGKMDALVVDAEGAPLLLHNVQQHAGHWLLVSLTGVRCNRDGYGAILTAEVGGRKLVRHCHADGSYASSSDKRVHFGLGAGTKVDRLTVQWPDGHTDVFTNLAANRIVSLREGDRRIRERQAH